MKDETSKVKSKRSPKAKGLSASPAVRRSQPPTAWNLIGDKDIWSMTDNELLKIIDALWITGPGVKCVSYNYSIGRFPYGWCFSVTNSWYKWSAKKYKHQFGAYSTLSGCLAGFLEYVVKNKIKPHKLAD